jgi:hypothetical protein
MTTNTKVVLASVIWITVAILGYRSIVQVLPKYGYFQRQPQGRLTAEQYTKLYQAEEVRAKKFLDSTSKPTRIKAKPVEQGNGFNYSGWRSDDERQLIYIKNTPLRQVISRLTGIPMNRVFQPSGSPMRWDIEAILPSDRREAVGELLRSIKWQREDYALPEKVHVFGVGTPPGADITPQPTGGRRTMNLGNQSLAGTVRNLQNWIQFVGQVQREHRNKRPLDPANANLSLNGTHDEIARRVARIYGVGLSVETRDTTHVLIYPSGSMTGGQMDEWVRSLSARANAL